MDHNLTLKIRNGTRSGKRLCDTCRSGRVIRGEAESEEVVYCHALDKQILFKVVECGDYEDRRVPSIHEMKAIAWVLRTDKSGQKIGFVDPSQRRQDKQLADEIEELGY